MNFKLFFKLGFVLFVILMVFDINNVVSAASLDPLKYPGVRVNDGIQPPDEPVRPSPDYAPHDAPSSYADGCHVGKDESNYKLCTYGAKTHYKYTMALVGDSHSAHWLPAIETFAYKNKIRVLYATKTGCAFSARLRTDYLTCNHYNNEHLKMILKYKPDVVMAKADQYAHEGVPPGFLRRFRQLNEQGINILALRNTAYWHVNVPQCVKKYGPKSTKCAVKREAQQPIDSNWHKLSYLEIPTNVRYVDFSPKMCTTNYCYPVQGNILKIRDGHHMTASYTRTFSTYIYNELMPMLKSARAKRLNS